jgi:hypothetical protein
MENGKFLEFFFKVWDFFGQWLDKYEEDWILVWRNWRVECQGNY